MHSIFRKASFLALVSILILKSASAQEMTPGMIEIRKEVADSVGAFYFFDTEMNIVRPQTTPVDTSLHHFHHYQSLQQNGRAYAWLGNTGLAYSNLKMPASLEITSQFGIHSYDAYRMTPANLAYYKLNVPFTVLAYTTGKDREQVFNGRHYQQVRQNLGVGLGFNIYNSMGSYLRQKSDNVSLAFQALYRTHNERYGIAGNFIANRFIHRENGGIANPEQFENNQETDRGRINIRLNNAENRWKENNTYFRQYLHLSKTKPHEDDSVTKVFSSFGTLVHTFNYQRLAQVYEDKNPRSNFYNQILADSTLTFDSLVLHTVFNQVQWNLPLIQSQHLDFTINTGIGHVFMHYRMMGINNKYSQVVPHFKPEIIFGKKLSVRGSFQRITGNFRNGDQEYGVEASLSLGERDPVRIKASLNRSATTPGLFYHLYQSNHFEWNNSFGKQKSNEAALSGHWRENSAGISLNTINGFAYLNSQAQPWWHQPQFSVLSAFIQHKLEWKGLTLHNILVYQQLSNESVLRLPKLVANSTVAYEMDFFQGALQAMVGIEVFYNTAWKAPAYMPALRTFYLQNERETGNYLYADAFINVRVKRARLFLLMQHANEGLMGYHYYMIPNYPMPDRALKFGINWMFYD